MVGVSFTSATPQAKTAKVPPATMPTIEAVRNLGIHNLSQSFVRREVREIMIYDDSIRWGRLVVKVGHI